MGGGGEARGGGSIACTMGGGGDARGVSTGGSAGPIACTIGGSSVSGGALSTFVRTVGELTKGRASLAGTAKGGSSAAGAGEASARPGSGGDGRARTVAELAKGGGSSPMGAVGAVIGVSEGVGVRATNER